MQDEVRRSRGVEVSAPITPSEPKVAPALEVALILTATGETYASWRVERQTPEAVENRMAAVIEELEDDVEELFFGD
jgi:hypothetical protein